MPGRATRAASWVSELGCSTHATASTGPGVPTAAAHSIAAAAAYTATATAAVATAAAAADATNTHARAHASPPWRVNREQHASNTTVSTQQRRDPV